MTLQDILAIAATGLVSLLSSGAIIIGLSGWLGKVWAERLMAKEKAKYESELAELKSTLERNNQQRIEETKSYLKVAQDKHLKGFQDKLATYRMCIDIIANMMSELTACFYITHQPPSIESLRSFDKQRLTVTGYLAMLAPQSLMDAFHALMDYLLSVIHDGVIFDWPKVRELSLTLLNEVRRDLGFDPTPTVYNGSR